MPETTGDLPTTEQASEEIFLSPRIIDMTAVEELEGRLRRVIDHALETGTALVTLDEQARDALRTLESAGPVLDERARGAAALLETLEERVTAAESLLGRAIERAERTERFEGDVERIVARATASLEARVDSMIERAESRLGELATSAQRAIDDGLGEAPRDAEATRVRVAETRRQAEEGVATLEARLKELRGAASEVRSPVVDRLMELCERANALIGEGTGGMSDLVVRAEALRDDTAHAVRQLEHTRRQTDQARTLIGGSLVSAAEEIDRLVERERALRAAVKASASACEEADGALAARLEALRSSIDPALERAEQEAGRLSRLIERSEEAAREAAEAMSRHRAAAERLDEALGKLEPWRATLLEGRDDLPPALLGMIDRVRAEIGEDVGRIAEGLHAIAAHAETVRLSVRERARGDSAD